MRTIRVDPEAQVRRTARKQGVSTMPTTNCEPTTADEPVTNTWRETRDEGLSTRQNGEPVGNMPVDYQDEADSLAILVKLWGHDASVVYDGPAAYRAAWTDRPDVLLLDIALPKLNGYELAGQLRRLRCFEETLLIATSGYADEVHSRRGADVGFDHYLPKPLELDTLENLLQREKDRLAKSLGHPALVGLPVVDRKPVGV
jgi:CheY-like chemotaxis protein